MGAMDAVIDREGIELPSDFDNYSFAELVSAGISPASAKAIKNARKLLSPTAGNSALASVPLGGRQDFLTMGRADKVSRSIYSHSIDRSLWWGTQGLGPV